MALDPLHVFRFRVDFRPSEGSDAEADFQAAFSEVSGLEATMEPTAITEGGANWGQRQLVGRTSFSTVILRRGLSTTRDLWTWFHHVNSEGSYAERMDVTVTLQDTAGEALMSWELSRALPVKFKVPDLSAVGQEVGIEELHLVFDHLSAEAGGAA
ncbi:MAG: phage tail protein [Myxococcales bacterium]|nr:phage tail protein [Myxococcales bacterium]